MKRSPRLALPLIAVERLSAEVAALRERQAATDARLAELEALVKRIASRP